MKTPRLTVLEFELKSVRSLRVSADLGVARAALDREEELQAELARARGEDVNVIPMAAGFVRRTEDPVEGSK